ncbi:unnamed protein product, partial [Heterotrigona itama]
MFILDEQEDYLKNPFFVKHEYGDFTPFLCYLIFAFICILNIAFCWYSHYRLFAKYTVLPYKIPPLDFSEQNRDILRHKRSKKFQSHMKSHHRNIWSCKN